MVKIISVGTLTITLVHPREVFEPAVKKCRKYYDILQEILILQKKILKSPKG
ncbi:hypothetical protein D6810_01410 [Candidatus Dojkabacteria bacterium]|uniref:Uncharacterized protein n=1 Tax=Candidatus Dojkabacteria bacterium TaxID=2099670 RepID=A0A3M0YZ46_9BACT|nr:MAG: hypothetical protein D6810_01410 [Candidatus Dojkabacteria bacterium]